MNETSAVEKDGVPHAVGSKSWASKLRVKARQLARESDLIFMELGKVLYFIWDTPDSPDKPGSSSDPLYARWGFESFAEYVEKELGMDRRRAQRLRKIWYALEVDCNGIDDKLKQDLVEMGSTKLRELSRVLTAENAQEWYDTCRDLNVNQIMEVINDHFDKLNEREKRFDDTTPDPEEQVQEPEEDADEGALYNENFKLYPQQQQSLKNAIDAARILSNNPKAKKGHCLDLICMDFIATNDIVSKSTDETREKYIAKMEQRLGLKLVAFDPKSGEIVHGLETLESLARRETD